MFNKEAMQQMFNAYGVWNNPVMMRDFIGNLQPKNFQPTAGTHNDTRNNANVITADKSLQGRVDKKQGLKMTCEGESDGLVLSSSSLCLKMTNQLKFSEVIP